jgi:hypothetical protein
MHVLKGERIELRDLTRKKKLHLDVVFLPFGLPGLQVLQLAILTLQ